MKKNKQTWTEKQTTTQKKNLKTTNIYLFSTFKSLVPRKPQNTIDK